MQQTAFQDAPGMRRSAGHARLRLRERGLASTVATASLEAARAVAHAAALGWWHAAVSLSGGRPLVPLPLPEGLALAELSAFLVTDARAFGADLAKLPVMEASAALGRLYTHALPSAHRASQGIFYTICQFLRSRCLTDLTTTS